MIVAPCHTVRRGVEAGRPFLQRTAQVSGETVRTGPFPPASSAGRCRWALPIFVPVMSILVQAWAAGATASLTVAEIGVPAEGDSVTVPILLSAPAGLRVAAIQFDVEFDASALALPSTPGVPEGSVPRIDVGAAAKAAGKQVNATVSAGKARVLIIGFNQEAVASGEIARLTFMIARDKIRPVEPVQIRNALLSDPNGTKVPVEARDGGVRLAAGVPGAGPIPAPVAASNCEKTSSMVLFSIVASCMLVGGTAAGVVWHRRARGKLRSQGTRAKQKRRPAV